MTPLDKPPIAVKLKIMLKRLFYIHILRYDVIFKVNIDMIFTYCAIHFDSKNLARVTVIAYFGPFFEVANF